MKDLHYYVNQVQVSNLLNIADELNCPSDCYEGVLVDNYIIYDAQDIRFENLPAGNSS